MSADAFEGWAVLELMGHRRLGGWIREVELAGAAMLRIDVPGVMTECERCLGFSVLNPDRKADVDPITCTDCAGLGWPVTATQFYAPSAVYCITPTTEEVARAAAVRSQPAPVARWELPTTTDSGQADDAVVVDGDPF